jgi:putative MATE family efflux protein
MLDVSSEEITGGSLMRALLTLAVPLLAQNLVQVFQKLVDLFWLGRFSATAVGAVGLVLPVIWVLFAATMAAPYVGTQVLVSQRVGNDDRRGAQTAAATGATLGVILGTVGGLVTFAYATEIVRLLLGFRPGGVDAAIVEYGATYLRVLAVGVPITAVGDALEGGFVGRGDSRVALYMSVAAVSVNLVLDPLLIFGYGGVPALGVAGAALASVAGYTASTGLAVYLAARGDLVSRSRVAFRLEEYYALLDVGAPPTAQIVAKQAVNVAMVSVVYAVGGASGLTAYVVGSRVASLVSIPAVGLQQATQSVVGQNLGAARPDRAGDATRLGTLLIAAGLAALGAVQFAIPATIATVLVPTLGPEELSLAVWFLRVLAFGYPALGVVYLVQAGFNGAGRTQVSMVSTLVQYWGVQLPVAVVGGVVLDYGLAAVFVSAVAANVTVAVLLGAYYVWVKGRMLSAAAEEIADASAE